MAPKKQPKRKHAAESPEASSDDRASKVSRTDATDSSKRRPRRIAAQTSQAKTKTLYEILDARKPAFDEDNSSQEDAFFTGPFLGRETIPNDLKLSDLCNNIHPIFAKELFDRAMNYDVLLVPLRLASLLLEFETLKPMLWTIIRRNVVEAPDAENDDEKARKCAYTVADDIRELKKMDQNQVSQVAQALRCLPSMVRYQLDVELPQGCMAKAASGEGPHSAVAVSGDGPHPHFQGGTKSLVKVSDHSYRRLETATKEHSDGNPDMAELISVQFNIAVSMVHEITHALYMAVEGAKNYEPFFGASAIAEIGFEAEYRLFGGRPDFYGCGGDQAQRYRLQPGNDGDLSRLKGINVLWEWPENHLVRSYVNMGHMIAWRSARLPKTDLAWKIPLTYISRLFSKDFWDVDVPKLGATALHPPKEVGHFFATTDDVELVYCEIPQGRLPETHEKVTGAGNWAIQRRPV